MKFKIIAIMAVLVLTSFGAAWAETGSLLTAGEDSSGCYATYTYGSGATYLQWCVTNHGNIQSLISPAGFNHLYPTYEGYSICSGGTSTYFDRGLYASEGSWINLNIIQPNGANTFPLTIQRTTSDAKFLLTQKFTQSTAGKSVSITMTLKNISGVTQTDVMLTRSAVLTIDNRPDQINYFDKTVDSVMGRYTHGVVATAETYGTAHFTSVRDWPQSWTAGDCNPPSNTLPAATWNGTSFITYIFGNMGVGASKTVKVTYKKI